MTTNEVKIDKTDETYCPNNEEFLSGIFGKMEDTPDSYPMLVSFNGNPHKGFKGRWRAFPRKNSSTMLESNNNYFSIASFYPDDDGTYRRKKEQFASLHAIMLDDVGSKIPFDKIKMESSWRLETSPGNFQFGFILREPIRDSRTADHLMDAIIATELSDPGAGGPTARLARLPVGVNGKHKEPFVCRIEQWNPNLRYTMEELATGLELKIRPINVPKQKVKRSKSTMDNLSIVTPRPEENIVIAALRQRSLYKAASSTGKHDITCPWKDEHTDGVDNGAVYFEPNNNFPVGGFKCHHGHCSNRRMRDLLEFLEVDGKAARMKTMICVIPGEIPHIVDAAEKELAATGSYYQRGGLIVAVTTDPGTKETRIQEINQPSLVRALADAASFEKYSGSSQETRTIDPPALHVSVLHSAMSYKHLPVIESLARQPYFRKDDTLAVKPGYDPASHLFGIFEEQGFTVSDNPTKDQAQEALAILDDILSEFSFATEISRSSALSAILTAAVRPSLPHAPMIHVRAHQVGSGKSYLCQVVTAIATPKKGTPVSFPKEDEECRKLLFAELLRAPAVIEFDNLTGDLAAHKSLCIVLTSEYMSDRILGFSKTATVSTRALFLSSGNNVGPVQDMARRCLTIDLDPLCETPATRRFERPNLVEDILRHRGKYVSAALTIVRAWIAAGSPKKECAAFSGYQKWSDYCRQPLLWLGRPDPVKAVLEAMADDPDRDTLGRLLKTWHQRFGERPAMIREALKESGELRDVLEDIAGEPDGINPRILGRWIKRNSGRVVSGLRFVQASGSRSAAAWCVKSVSSVL